MKCVGKGRIKKRESKYDKEKANTDRRVLLREESEEG